MMCIRCVLIWFYFSTTHALTNFVGICPLTWKQHNIYKNKCYKISTDKQKYDDTAIGCNMMYKEAVIASVYNRNIHDFLVNSILKSSSEPFYIGLKKEGSEYAFPEINEVLSSWSVWDGSNSICALYKLSASGWKWTTNNCNPPRHYLCEYTIPNQEVNVTPVALVDGKEDTLSGRLEVYHNGIWGTVRHDTPPSSLGDVVCDMLGLTSSHTTLTGAPPGTGRVWLDKINCDVGQNNNLDDCIANEGGHWIAFYDHSSDVIVFCVNNTNDTISSVTVMPSTKSNSVTTGIPTTMSVMTDLGTTNMTISLINTTPVTTTAPHTSDSKSQTNSSNYMSTICDTITHSLTLTETYSITIRITDHVTTSISIYTSITPTVAIQPSVIHITSTISSSATQRTFTQPGIQQYTAEQQSKAKNSARYSTATRHDNRPSAQALGSFGIIILVVVICSIIMLDVGVPHGFQKFKCYCHKRNHIPRSKKRKKEKLNSKTESKTQNQPPVGDSLTSI